MSMDALKSIKLTEDEADDLKKQAVQKAREIVVAAEREGDSLLRNVTKEAQQNSQVLLEKAEREAETEVELLRKTHEKQKQILIKKANAGMQKAVSMIVGKVVDLNGNR